MRTLLRIVAWLITLIVGVWCLYHSIIYLSDWIGEFWAFLSLIFFPFVIAIVPLIAMIRDGWWELWLVTYASGIVSTILFNLSEPIFDNNFSPFKQNLKTQPPPEINEREKIIMWQRRILQDKPIDFSLIIKDIKSGEPTVVSKEQWLEMIDTGEFAGYFISKWW